MSWDWQKRLQSEDPAPLPDDSSFGRLAAVASDQEQEPADAGQTGRAEASTRGAAGVAFTRSPATRGAPGMTSTRGAGGMDWHPTGAAAKDGPSLPRGGLPQLLYGEEHRCAYCRGTGQMRGTNQCPVCRGSGKVSLAPPVVRCAFCNGGGHKPVGSTMTCLVCRGAGVVRVKPPIQICPNCKGRGRQMGHSLYCGLCRGSGVVTVPESRELVEHDSRFGINDRRTY